MPDGMCLICLSWINAEDAEDVSVQFGMPSNALWQAIHAQLICTYIENSMQCRALEAVQRRQIGLTSRMQRLQPSCCPVCLTEGL